MELDLNKPHKGSIGWWTIRKDFNERLFIVGKYLTHPEFAGEYGYTSYIMKMMPTIITGKGESTEIETMNSRYTLIGPKLTEDEYAAAMNVYNTNKMSMAR